ncbi:MAG: polyprenyl synthetase family protein [Treponema sp.]|nr:polyprenyl synthetase family protein [Treponema sp.]
MNKALTDYLDKIEGILNTYLPSHVNGAWKDLSFGSIDSCVTEEHISNLLAPCKSLLDLGGKRWRPLLLVLCAQMTASAKKSSSDIKNAVDLACKITPLVEFAHTGSLIQDDMEDAADTRRGKPCAHITYGLDAALNASTWLFFQALVCIKELPLSDSQKLTLNDLFALELRRLSLGQAMDILWHRNPQMIPTSDQYTAMVRNKTGTLSRLAVKLGVFAGGGSGEEIEKAGTYAQDIGTGFQIIDDVINLTTGNPGKKRGDDIVEGKKSFPVLLHLEKNPSDREKLAFLFKKARKEGIASSAVEEAISLLTESGAVNEARIKGKEIISKSASELASLYGDKSSEGSELILELLKSLEEKA